MKAKAAKIDMTAHLIFKAGEWYSSFAPIQYLLRELLQTLFKGTFVR